MNRKQRIQKLLSNVFANININVIDNSIEHMGHNNFDGKKETHFRILIENKAKNTLSRLELHRKINNLLEDEFNTGLHALEIKII